MEGDMASGLGCSDLSAVCMAETHEGQWRFGIKNVVESWWRLSLGKAMMGEIAGRSGVGVKVEEIFCLIQNISRVG